MKVLLFVAVVCFLLLGFLGQALAARPSNQQPLHRKKVQLSVRQNLRVIAARQKKRSFKFVDSEAVARSTVSQTMRMDDATFERSAN